MSEGVTLLGALVRPPAGEVEDLAGVVRHREGDVECLQFVEALAGVCHARLSLEKTGVGELQHDGQVKTHRLIGGRDPNARRNRRVLV